MIVGIPRGLLFYEYYPLWKTFFEMAGLDLVASPPTTRRVLDAGVVAAVDEACLPVKAYLGHCVEVASRSDVVFVPRIVSVERGAYTCPKLLGIPDMARALRRGFEVLSVVVDYTRRGHDWFSAAMEMAAATGIPRFRAVRAWLAAVSEYRRFSRTLERSDGWFDPAAGTTAPAARNAALRVLVLGHAYLINDAGISLGVKEHLERLGVRAFAPESVPQALRAEYSRTMPKHLFWTYERRMYGSALCAMDTAMCDGIVQVVSFGCGPDSMVGELIRREAGCRRVPYMTLTVDEHTGQAGTVTRLEAFVDMLKRRARAGGPLA